MKKLLIVFLFLPNILFARKFYFSSSTGSDSWTTAQALNDSTHAWKTLVQLQAFANGFYPFTSLNKAQTSDSFYFKRGDNFNNGHNGIVDSNFRYVSCSWQYYPIEGYTAPSGTEGHPILFTNYGNPSLPLPNFYFPTASPPEYGNPIQHNVLEIVGVKWITLDGLQFNDANFPTADKVNPAYTRGSMIWGSYQSGDNQRIPSLRKKMNSHCVIKNCYFANSSFGFHEIYCDTCEIGNNTFENFKSSIDTAGVHDVAAGAIDGLQGYYINIHHNTIKGSWAKSGRVSSTQGMVGVAMNTFLLLHSRIAYNTFIDNRHIIEIGNLDQTDATNGAQYDTIAYNKIINGSPNIIYLQPTTGSFAGKIKHLAFYNNTIVENQSSRQSGSNFGYDRDGNGESFNQFWFFANKYRATNYIATTGVISAGSHSITVSSTQGITVGGRVYAPEGVPIFRVDPINPLNPAPAIPLVLSIVGNVVTIDSAALMSTPSVPPTLFTFYPPLDSIGLTWSQPPNVSNSGNGGSWDNPNENARPIQGVQNGDVTDTVIDIRNNIFYYTNGTQMLYDNASHSWWKHNNNLYYLKGGFTYQTSTGATINNATRLGSGATLGTNERIYTTKFFVDTSATLPENWNLYIDSATSFAVTGGSSIVGFPTDFAGNPVTGTPTMGIYQYTAVNILPTITTTAASSINTNIATSGGNITTDGGSPITRRGLMYSLTAITDTTTGTKVVDGSLGTGVFTTSLTGLTPSTQYHIRAFALNSVGVSYGADLTFTTLAVIIPPTVTTTPASSILLTTATTGGNVTTDGGASVISRGILYSLTAIPSDTTSSTKINSGTGTGTFTTSLTLLSGNTLYHIRAFAVNSAGVSFGTDLTFTTITTPTVTTTSPTGIGQIIATSGGNVISNGGSAVTRRGLVYSLSPIADTSGGTRLIDAGVGNGAYITTISGLVANTTYHIRAFAVNLAGVSLGADLTFTTLAIPVLPIVQTITSNITSVSALIYNNVSSEGSSPVTRRGLVWSISPTLTDTTTGTLIIDAGTGLGNYTSSITGLSAGTLYYAIAFAVNSVGVAYGTRITIMTWSLPTVTTTSPTSITTTSASTGGFITDYGATIVYKRALIYSTSPIADTNSTVGGGKVYNSTNVTVYPILLNALLPNTTYYIRAYVVNGLGVGLGNELNFKTLAPIPPSLPTITTSPATSITLTSAISGGNITLDGGASVFRRGLMYSTTPITDTTTGTKIIAGTSGVGAFSISLTSLSINTKYYIRAFALNSVGISYGAELTFTITTNSFKTRKKFIQRL